MAYKRKSATTKRRTTARKKTAQKVTNVTIKL